jgi:hypothetical protein
VWSRSGRWEAREPPATDDNTDVNNCSAVLVNVVCVGQINGNDVTVNIGDVGSDNDLNALTTKLENVFVRVANISDINILAADLAAAVQTIVNTTLTNTVNNTVTTITRNCSVLVTPPPATTQTNTVTVTCS